MAGFFGFGGPSTTVDIELDNVAQRKSVEIAAEKGKIEKLYLYIGSEPVSGKIKLNLSPKTKKIEHLGIRIEFIGQIELFYDRGNHYEFTSLVRELAPAGDLTESKVFNFEFLNVEKQYESYNGINVRLRYFLKFTVQRSFSSNIIKEQDIWVQNFQKPPEINNSIKMEVGIEDCFTDDHEVLTDSGFKPFTSVREGDLIAAVVPDNGRHKIEMQEPVRQADGRMYLEKVLGEDKRLVNVKTSQNGGVALTTTDTHDWYAETQDDVNGWSGRMDKVKIRDLVQRDKQFRVMGAVSDGLAPLPEDRAEWLSICKQLGLTSDQHKKAFLEVYGYCCGAATLKEDNRLPYVKVGTKDKAYIEALFARLGMTDYSSTTTNAGEHRFVIKNESWRRLIHRENATASTDFAQTANASVIKSHNGFSEWVFRSLVKDELRCIINGYIAWSGASSEQELYTSSVDVRDSLSRLFLLAGFSAKSRVISEANPNPCWAVSYSDSDSAGTRPTVDQKDWTVVPAPAGLKVYCVTVPSGLIIVRRRTDNEVSQPVVCGNCLHIEFEYNKSKYHLKDVIIGKIYFLLVRIKIKHMEIALIKRESTGTGPNLYNESETLTKFEIMDGAPVRGESIPVRLFLGGFELTPSYRNVHNKFSVKYYLNLVLVDEEDRRYFKQQEITLWRKGTAKQLAQSGAKELPTHGPEDVPANPTTTAAAPAAPSTK